MLPDGKWGELVITTIGMEAQPLIRYRTGDWSRIIPGRCLCGSEIKRLDFVKRMDPLGSIREMDELLFEIPELVDYCVKIVDGKRKLQRFLHRTMEKNESGVFWKRRIFVHGTAKKQSGKMGRCILANELQGSDFVVSWNHCLACYSG